VLIKIESPTDRKRSVCYLPWFAARADFERRTSERGAGERPVLGEDPLGHSVRLLFLAASDCSDDERREPDRKKGRADH